MRAFLAVVSAAVLLAFAATADASCAPLEPIAQRIARADAVVWGRVTGFEGAPLPDRRAMLVRVLTVYKGDVPQEIFVGAGPGAEGGPGGPVATSVEYSAERGTDHTFYLKRHAPAGFTTDACSGSHPGEPTDEERAALGSGRPPSQSGPRESDRAIGVAASLLALIVPVVALRLALARA